ncbi:MULTISPECIES: proline dehydrogenase family protein [unclassified Imperialibacter]|uniref:proline dehydrogenase family protein n=1 Tax=unclassified Imperialibacter TaxID=2629706 RepID=UPI00125BE739|nr:MULTISPECIES: proline dehydrogenase family protein [unclassified Imperialibacter]CAD5254972.1 Proline dehydrogenase [Imperialibacter sp. 75]CAD5263509.1 Proline dehydrogenase [Imperialibacter sp. 89]VVT35457.1 Bifunctional proline dehydrogenase/pyrroline-5-carboxylate dehydrogenase [Imperialibacter sp. EC-SDR9]
MPVTHPFTFEDTEVAFASKSDRELKKMYWLFAAMNSNFLVRFGTQGVILALKMKLPIKKLIKSTVFGHFCGGETIQECKQTISELGASGIGTILDYSAEGEKTEAGFEANKEEIMQTVMNAATSAHIPFAVMKVSGLGSEELMTKSQDGKQLNGKEQKAFDNIHRRVEELCSKAHELNVRIFIDAEDYAYQGVIDGLALEMMRKYNKERVIVYTTFQFYRWDAYDKLVVLHEKGKAEGFYIGVKLVRGAYMENERERAEDLGYKDPIQPTKQATDIDYNRALDFCAANHKRIAFCSGSHNEQSNALLTSLMQQYGIAKDDPGVFFAQLYGMSDNISFKLSKEGYNVAKYVPYGPLEKVMPYLIRRAEENTSVAGQTGREFSFIKKEIERRKLSAI